MPLAQSIDVEGKRTLQLWFVLPLDKPNALHADDVAYGLRSGALGLILI
jgi:hypothetical protein